MANILEFELHPKVRPFVEQLLECGQVNFFQNVSVSHLQCGSKSHTFNDRFLVTLPYGYGDAIKIYIFFNATDLQNYDMVIQDNVKFQKYLTDMAYGSCPVEQFDPRNHRSLFHVINGLKECFHDMNQEFYSQISPVYRKTIESLNNSGCISCFESSIENGTMKFLVKLNVTDEMENFHFAFPNCDDTLIEMYCTFKTGLFDGSSPADEAVTLWPSQALGALLGKSPIAFQPSYDKTLCPIEEFLPKIARDISLACKSWQELMEARRDFMVWMAFYLQNRLIFCDFETYLEAQIGIAIPTSNVNIIVEVKLHPNSLAAFPDIFVQAVDLTKNVISYSKLVPPENQRFVTLDESMAKFICSDHLEYIQALVLSEM